MQLFRSEEEIDEWMALTGYPKGAAFSPEQLWDLSKRWWDDRLLFDWQRRPIAERQTLLQEAGLTGPFWDLTVAKSS